MDSLRKKVRELLFGLGRTQAPEVVIKRDILLAALGPQTTSKLTITNTLYSSRPAMSFDSAKQIALLNEVGPQTQHALVEVKREETIAALLEWELTDGKKV